MATLATDTFAGRTVGSGWGTASDGKTWSLKNGSFLVLSVGSNEGKCNHGGPGEMLLGSGTPTDCEGLIRLSQGDAADLVGLILRDDGTGNNNYMCGIGEFANDLVIYKIASGSRSYIDIQATGITISAGSFYWIRFQIIGTALKARIWANGSSEPGTWLCSGTDATYASGQYGVYLNTQTATDAQFDTYSVNDTNAGPTTNTRTVTTSAALQTTNTRTVTTSAALQTTTTRTVSTSAALKTTNTRTVVTSASLQIAATPISPLTMPIISRGVPAFTNDDFSGSFPASNANDSTYSTVWRCASTPAANGNSGNLTTPVYLAYDLSGVNSAQRKNCVVVWYDDCPGTGAYDYTIPNDNPTNIANAYTIDANAGAGGGSPPGSSWVTLVTVTGNVYHSRQHAVDLTGYNWVRIRVTAIVGSTANNNCALNMDVHDVHLGNYDNWIFFGDSICRQAFLHSDTTIPAQIHTLKPNYFPLMENGGIGGLLSADGVSHLSTWLPLFSGQYVGLLYGTNDANVAAAGNGTFGPTFITNMSTMMTAIIDAGKTPVIPRSICWGGTTNLLANVPVINSALAQLATSFPGTVVGPDLYTYFNNNQSLINASDHIHPTLPTGNAAYQNLWVQALASTIYGGNTVLGRKHGLGSMQ